MTSADAALRYDRKADLEGEDSLSAIARLIGRGATVLDLGAATGKLGAYLREHKECVCDGVELEPKAAALARAHYRTLLELNLESAILAEHFPELEMGDSALSALRGYSWPGNIRELRNAVIQAGVMSQGGQITAQAFRKLVEEFQTINYFSLPDRYAPGTPNCPRTVTDMPSAFRRGARRSM